MTTTPETPVTVLRCSTCSWTGFADTLPIHPDECGGTPAPIEVECAVCHDPILQGQARATAQEPAEFRHYECAAGSPLPALDIGQLRVIRE